VSRVYEYWCENVRQRWSRVPCPHCEGRQQEQQKDKDGKVHYWWTSQCDVVCVRCSTDLDDDPR
jgi:hypothetical protein